MARRVRAKILARRQKKAARKVMGRPPKKEKANELTATTAKAVALLFSDHPRHKDSKEHAQLLAAMKDANVATEDQPEQDVFEENKEEA